MWSFLLGSAAGLFALKNGPLLRRALAWMFVKSEDGLEVAGKHARRTGMLVVEDVQDILAEASALRSAERAKEAVYTQSGNSNIGIN